MSGSQTPVGPKREPSRVGETFPLSYGQEGLWLGEQLISAGDIHYHNFPLLIEITGPLDTRALERSLEELIAVHEIWRTSYRQNRGKLVQKIETAPHVHLEVTELDAEGDATAAVREYVIQQTRPAFDLKKGPPPLRWNLVRLAPESHVLVLVIHHIACDGWSSEIALKQLAAAYECVAAGLPPKLSAPLQYADWATEQRKGVKKGRFTSGISHWKDVLSNSNVPPLPTDNPRTSEVSHHGAFYSYKLDNALVTGVHDFSRAHRTSVFPVLLAAFSVALARFAGDRKLAIGSPFANRIAAEAEGALGYFVNFLPLVLDLSKANTFKQAISTVSGALFGAFEHLEAPVEAAIAELRASGANLDTFGRYQALFTVVQHDDDDHDCGGLRWKLLPPHDRIATDDIAVEIHRDAEQLVAEFFYRPTLYDEKTIEALANDFAAVLATGIGDPTSGIEYT